MARHLPRLSHLQFLALGTLLADAQPGRRIRDAVARYGLRRTAAAFYQFMSRLERDGLADGWYEQIRIGDQSVTERRYRITASGRKAWSQTRAFYEEVAAEATGGGLVNA